MAKLTKQTVAAVSKGKKETVAKPKTSPKTASKVTAKPAATKTTAKPKATAQKTTPKAAKPAGATTGVTLAKTTDITDKINELQEENVKLNFLFTQTKQQLDTQSVKLVTDEARVKELENFLESSFNKIGKIRERLANISKSEESKS